MVRVTIISVLGLVAAVAANAGEIQIGGVNGLTSNYLTQGAGAVCAAGTGDCIHGSTSGFAEANFDNVLFAGATAAPTPYTGYSTGAASAGTFSSNANSTPAGGVTFSAINDGLTSGASNNFWGSTNTGMSSITIPIGVFDVADIAFMLQNEGGVLNNNDTSVGFAFGSTPNATSGLTTFTVNLVNVNNSGSGEVRSAVICNMTGNANCSEGTGGTNPSSTLAPSSVVNGVTVDTSSIFTTTYANIASGYYANTAGHLKLDDQDFVFGSAYDNLYLVSVTVFEKDGGTNDSQTALTAITVDQAPEPGTIMLLLAGVGGIGLARRFRRA